MKPTDWMFLVIVGMFLGFFFSAYKEQNNKLSNINEQLRSCIQKDNMDYLEQF